MGTELQKIDEVSEEQRVKIVTMLISGEFPIDSEIARAVGVQPKVVTDMLKNDPELASLRKQSEWEMAQQIEKASVNLAVNGRNEMARQKAQEFLLKKLMPEKYGDEAVKDSGNVGKRVNIFLKLPEVNVDANGIPVAHSESPLKPKVIDV